MEDILHKTCSKLKKEKVLNTLMLLENYLPDIISSVHEKLRTPNQYEWTDNEQRKLKAAMEFFPAQDFIREPEDRWRRVSGFVNTKNINECKEELQFQEVRIISELNFRHSKNQELKAKAIWSNKLHLSLLTPSDLAPKRRKTMETRKKILGTKRNMLREVGIK